MIDNGDSEAWGGGRGGGWWEINVYNVCYLSDGYSKSSDFTTMKSIHVI